MFSQPVDIVHVSNMVSEILCRLCSEKMTNKFSDHVIESLWIHCTMCETLESYVHS